MFSDRREKTCCVEFKTISNPRSLESSTKIGLQGKLNLACRFREHAIKLTHPILNLAPARR